MLPCACVCCGPCVYYDWAVMSVLKASQLPAVSVTIRLIKLKAVVRYSGDIAQGAALFLRRDSSLLTFSVYICDANISISYTSITLCAC